jgi:ATP-binding cassette subfamily F protein uup
VSLAYADRPIFDNLTWQLGPGDRFALVGVNGSGKSSLMKVLAQELEPDAGTVERGTTVKLAHLSQDTAEIPGHLRVLEAVEEVRGFGRLAHGTEVSASSLLERFGFRGERARTLVKDLSGGERRRLQLMRLLLGEPNVLLLDEPTNDLDIETLRALEDLLDRWPGTLLVVSHDRYFVERVCDNVYALTGDGRITHLPGGIEQYLTLRRPEPEAAKPAERATPNQAVVRAARKETQRLERALEKLAERDKRLHEEMAAAATDYTRLNALQRELEDNAAERDRLEHEWLEAAEQAG